MECPTCEGKKFGIAHFNTGPDSSKHRWGEVACFTCNGVGSITDEHAKRIKDGKARREARIARGESMMESAARLGITVVALSALEHGRDASANA